MRSVCSTPRSSEVISIRQEGKETGISIQSLMDTLERGHPEVLGATTLTLGFKGTPDIAARQWEGAHNNTVEEIQGITFRVHIYTAHCTNGPKYEVGIHRPIK